MKQTKIAIIFTLYTIFGYSQDETVKVIDVLLNEFDISYSELYVQSEKEKTYFSKHSFKEQTVMSIPEEILNEIERYSNDNFENEWAKDLLINTFKKHQFKVKAYLTKDEVTKLFNDTGKQYVIVISQPLFDEEQEHCVISITHRMYHGRASGASYFLKKIYGKWVLLEVFDLWIT